MNSLAEKKNLEKENPVTGYGRCCGSFGELLQGVLPGDEKFLVHLKIQDYSEAEIEFTERCGKSEFDLPEGEFPVNLIKSYSLIHNILHVNRFPCRFNIKIKSSLPDGKGLSSSTADMVASVRALEDALNYKISPESLSEMISRIEPNDGLHFAGSVAYNYIFGKIYYQTDRVPPLVILGLDTGGTVDTVNFNKIQTVFSKKEKQYYAALLVEMKDALENNDISSICSISTESSVLWQKILPKPGFNKFLEIRKDLGSYGLINSHSGSFLGFAFRESSEIISLSEEIRKIFPEYELRIFYTESCALL